MPLDIERRRAWRKEWIKANPSKVLQYRKTKMEKHRDKVNEQKRASHARNRESVLERRREAYRERRESILSANAKWRKENDEKVKQYQSNRRKEMVGEIKEQRRTLNGRYAQYKNSAKTMDRCFLLTKEEFMSFWGLPCVYCGDPIAGIGLDRVDSTKGYEIGNVVPCCRWCNIMKLNKGVDDFLDHCRKVVAKNETQ